MDKIITSSELMINDFFELGLKDRTAKVSILKIGKKSVDIVLDGNERVCPLDVLIPINLTDDILINEYKFCRRKLKINKEEINDLFKEINNYFISINKNGSKYSVSITTINSEKICDSYNIEYLHTLQNIIRSNINSEIN